MVAFFFLAWVTAWVTMVVVVFGVDHCGGCGFWHGYCGGCGVFFFFFFCCDQCLKEEVGMAGFLGCSNR